MPSRMSILTKINQERGFVSTVRTADLVKYADFLSGSCLIFPHKSGGQIDLYTNAMVREVTVDGNGKATGVNYIDKQI